jgi:ribonuclease J
MNKLTDWIKRSQDGPEPGKKPEGNQPVFNKKNLAPQGSQNKPQGNRHHQKHQNKPQGNRHQSKPQNQEQNQDRGGRKLRIIPIGGLDEVGKNCTAIEYGHDIIVIDIGLQFPEDEMYGVDYLIPDSTYLEQNKGRIRGIIVTHGHLDHIGGLKNVLPKLNYPPVYGTRLTLGLIEKGLKEYKMSSKVKLNPISDESKMKLGCFGVEFFRINHSIPDCVGVILRTPVGNLVHSGDFKFDYNPAIGKPADFQKIAAIGKEGVLAAMIESTNAMKPGPVLSEQAVGETLEHIVEKTKGRLIIASFSSVIGRIGQLIQYAHKNGRKVFISGRSMVDNIEIATKLGYIHIPKDTLRQMNSLNSLPPNKVMIITTGAQGEEMSALSRMGLGSHMQIQIKPGDTVVLSSSPIPGNERAIATISNNLVRFGAKIITNNDMDVHTSGHGNQEDLKLMYSLLRPKYLIPIHGELSMRHAHKDLVMALGHEERDIAMLENGDILELDHQKNMRKSKSKVPANMVMVEGSDSGGNVATQIQTERQHLAHNGILIVLYRVYQHNMTLIADPAITSRGFIYMQDSNEVINEATQVAKKAYLDWQDSDRKSDAKDLIKSALLRFLQKRIAKQPVIVPIIVKQ